MPPVRSLQHHRLLLRPLLLMALVVCALTTACGPDSRSAVDLGRTLASPTLNPDLVSVSLPEAPGTPHCPNDALLAQKFAPALSLAPDDEAPRPVEILLDHASLVHRRGDRDIEDPTVDPTQLAALTNQKDAYLRLPPAIDDRLGMRRLYDEALRTDRGGQRYPVTAYARVHCARTTTGMGDQTVLQYWFFYLYNDATNLHQGDWEMVQVVLDGSLQPRYAAYAQHTWYSWRRWDEMLVHTRTSGDGRPEEHPRVYVARGSHASYFQYAPDGFGSDRLTDTTNLVIPAIRLLPSVDDDVPGYGWLRFAGHWGETAIKGAGCKNCDSGPVGPVFNSGGQKWQVPLDWGSQRPARDDLLTSRTARICVIGGLAVHFYDVQNRHTGPAADGRFDLNIPGAAHFTRPDNRSTTVLLPKFSNTSVGRIDIEGGDLTNLRVLLPGDGAVTDVRFPPVSLGARGLARLELGKGSLVLLVDANRDGVFEDRVAPLPPTG